MPIGWLLFLIFAPIACAMAGAIPTWLFTRAHYERRLDAVYEDGWRAGRQWYPPEVSGSAEWYPAPPSVHHDSTLPAPVRAAEALPALPAPGGEGGRHSAPEGAPLRLADLEAVARVRAEFARIRASLGLSA